MAGTLLIIGGIALMWASREIKKLKEQIEILEYQLEKLKSQSKEP